MVRLGRAAHPVPANLVVASGAGTIWSASATGSSERVWLVDETTGNARALHRAGPPEIPLSARPEFGVVLNNSRVFLSGSDTAAGVEPFVIDLCPADLDNDGVADLADFASFFTALDVSDQLADRNRDGEVDLSDFFWFFDSFDLGCPDGLS